MNEMDLEVNRLLMREMGLEVGNGQRIIDQDTGISMKFKGMDIVAPGHYGGNGSIEFDPHNNRRMMSTLFGYFLEKHSDESDVDVLTYYNIDGDNNKSSIQCKMSDHSLITSKPYLRDSLKCADIIIQLNGGASPNLEKYDIEPQPTTVKRRGATSGKNKSNTKTAKNSK